MVASDPAQYETYQDRGRSYTQDYQVQLGKEFHGFLRVSSYIQRLCGLLVDLGKSIFNLLVGFVLAKGVYSPNRSWYPTNQGNLQQQTNDASKRSTYGEEGKPGQEQGNQQTHVNYFQKFWDFSFKQCFVAAALGIYLFMQEVVAELKRTGLVYQARTLPLVLRIGFKPYHLFRLCPCFASLSSGKGYFYFRRILFNTGSIHAIR